MIASVISNQNSLIPQNPSLITLRNSLFGWRRELAAEVRGISGSVASRIGLA
jgi:hypothetical protein